MSFAQAEVGRSFGRDESARFSAYVRPFLALSVTPSEALPLLADLRQLAPTATNAEKTAFRFAGMRVEEVAKRETLARAKVSRAASRVPASVAPAGLPK